MDATLLHVSKFWIWNHIVWMKHTNKFLFVVSACCNNLACQVPDLIFGEVSRGKSGLQYENRDQDKIFHRVAEAYIHLP